MERIDRPVEYGFGVFLVVSLIFHLGALGLFSLVRMPEFSEEVEERVTEVLPVAVRPYQPVERRAPDDPYGWLEPGISPPEAPEPAVDPAEDAIYTRLPDLFRRSPPPPRAERRVRPEEAVPRPRLERERVPAPVPEVEGPGYEDEVEEDREFQVADLRVPDYPGVEEEEPEDDLLSPGDEISRAPAPPPPADELLSPGDDPTAERRRKIQHRPPFPHAAVGDILPEADVMASFDLTVSAGGEVKAVEVVQSSNNSRLDREISNWIKSWEYHPADRREVFGVRIEIPSE